MHWTFGTFVWSVFVVFLWFAVIWMFIALLVGAFSATFAATVGGRLRDSAYA